MTNSSIQLAIYFIQVSTSSIHSIAVSQRTVSKNNTRKKSFRNIVKQSVEQQVHQSHHDEIDEDTLEFTQLENIKHINGVSRVRQAKSLT